MQIRPSLCGILQFIFIYSRFFEYLYCEGHSISAKKCNEYGKHVYTQEFGPVMSLNPTVQNVSHCGMVSVPLIIGGMKAAEEEFPHMAVIGFGETPHSVMSWSCGGALISELYVLTAAHCLRSREKGLSQKVRLGALYLPRPSEEEQDILISQRIPYPHYTAHYKYHDIALLKLKKKAIFSPFVRPVCLSRSQPSAGTRALATGFGVDDPDDDQGTESLMKVELQVYKNKLCSKKFGSNVPGMNRGVTDEMLCAGHLEGGRDTCQGDSGGPLQIVLEKPYCMYSLIGVTSFGASCGFRDMPAIYTNVYRYLPWIEKIVWQH